MQNKYSIKAMELFKSGYNCAQAVFGAFAHEYGIDEKTAFMLSSSFGGGIGRLREVCGAASGMVMVLGLAEGDYDKNDNNAKMEHYKKVQELMQKFKEENGSYICRELLALPEQSELSPVPEKRTAEYYKKRPCGELVGCAAQIIAEYLGLK